MKTRIRSGFFFAQHPIVEKLFSKIFAETKNACIFVPQNNNIMNTFKKISSFTTQPNHFTGTVANKDLADCGKIHINFYVEQKTIGVDVAGFCSSFVFVFNPKNQKQQRLNEYFLERYILPCHNAEELLNTLFV